MIVLGVVCLVIAAFVTALNGYLLVRRAQGRWAPSPVLFASSANLAMGLYCLGIVDGPWAATIGLLHCIAEMGVLLFLDRATDRIVQRVLSWWRGE